MSKEGIPAVYEVSAAAEKRADIIKHPGKTAQDRMPVAERPRVIAHNVRLIVAQSFSELAN